MYFSFLIRTFDFSSTVYKIVDADSQSGTKYIKYFYVLGWWSLVTMEWKWCITTKSIIYPSCQHFLHDSEIQQPVIDLAGILIWGLWLVRYIRELNRGRVLVCERCLLRSNPKVQELTKIWQVILAPGLWLASRAAAGHRQAAAT